MLLLHAVLAAICLSLLHGGLQAPYGTPLLESLTQFFQEAMPPFAAFVGLLELFVLIAIVVCCFGHWCLMQATMPSDSPLMSRVPRSFASNLSLNLLRRVWHWRLVLTRLLLFRSRSRALASTAADLAGAAPLLI